MDFRCGDAAQWTRALAAYSDRIAALDKPDLLPLDDFYRRRLPALLRGRSPGPFITRPELAQLMRWKLARGKWRPRLLEFVSSLDEEAVESSSRKAFGSLPDVSKAVSELTVLKGVGPATASAVLAAYAPDVAPFMSDEAMVAALGHSKDYSLKQYLLFVEKLQAKAKELSTEGQLFTPSDVERALWSSAVEATLGNSQSDSVAKTDGSKMSKRKRKR
ncbi:hypothetical protein NL676_025973 [Syzygium grande]|nr:hypothetical protein NL676_025973 [Syzygium grande]